MLQFFSESWAPSREAAPEAAEEGKAEVVAEAEAEQAIAAQRAALEGKHWKGEHWVGEHWKGEHWEGEHWEGEHCWEGEHSSRSRRILHRTDHAVMGLDHAQEDAHGNNTEMIRDVVMSTRDVEMSTRDVEMSRDVKMSYDVSLGCLPPSSALRRSCAELVSCSAYESLMTAVVVISSLLLTVESPRLDPASTLHLTLRLANYGFTLLFLLEAILKSVAFGFAFTPRSYLSLHWNRLDFALLVLALGGISCELLLHLGWFEDSLALQALRVLRPLRLLSRNGGVKLILSSLYEAMPAVIDVIGVIALVQLVFAIIGMQVRLRAPPGRTCIALTPQSHAP